MPILAMAIGLASAFAPRASALEVARRDSSRTALIGLRYHENNCLGCDYACGEDYRLLDDSLFIRVRAGYAFMPERWMFNDSAPGWCDVVEVTPEGDVRLALPGMLRSGPGPHDPAFPETLLVTHGYVFASVLADDGGVTYRLVVLDSLPPGRTLGIPKGPKPPLASTRAKPVVERRLPISMPAGYGGPWGTVSLTVHLDERGRFDHATVSRGVSRILDMAAISNVRRWKYRLGVPCRGRGPVLQLQLEVPFPPPPRE